MLREFSSDFANRLGQATIRYAKEVEEFNNASDSFPGGMRAIEDQFRQIMSQCIQTSRTFKCLRANGKIEEFERYIEYRKDLQAINELEQDIIAEEFSKFNRNAESISRLVESVRRMENRQRALLKRRGTLDKIRLTMEVIKALNTIADEGSIKRIETENASDETDRESTTVEMVERKISSAVDDGGSTSGTMENVEFSTDRTLTTSEKQVLEMPTGESSEEQLEVKQSSSKIDQSSIADSIEAQQEMAEVAARSDNEAIEELLKSTEIDAGSTREVVEELAQLEKSLAILRLLKKCLGLPEEASDTEEKSKERLEKLSLQFKDLDELFGELETVKKEFLEL